MKLFTCDPAPNPLRLKRFMDYKGIELNTTQIDLASEEQLGDDYRAIVPEATVPALILDDGTVLTAVIAIAHYLELQFPDKPLLGVRAEEKAAILNWNHRIFGEVFGPIADAFRNGHPKYAGRALPGPADVAQIPQLVERGTRRLQDAFVMLNDALSQRTFLAGETLSFADIDLLVAIEFAKWGARRSPDASLEHLQRWREHTEAALLN